MRIQEIADVREISPAAWDGLYARSSEATVFQSYEWLCAWWRFFGEGKARGKVLVAYEDDRLVGAIPLYEVPGSGRMAGRAILKLLGSEHADYQCLLFDKDRNDVPVRLLEAARELTSGRCEMLLEELPQFSTMDILLREGGGELAGKVIIHGDSTPCPRLAISGNDNGVRAVLRKQSLRRHAKQLSGQGTLRITHLSDPKEIGRLLPAFFDQHIVRWRSTPFPSLFEKNANRSFYAYLTEVLGARKGILMSVLDVDDVPVAFHFGLCSAGDLLWYKPSFDVRFAKFSPGEVLLKCMIEHAVDQGFDSIDFTRGGEAFKYRFASEVRYNSSYLVTGRKWYGRYRALRSRIGRLRRMDWVMPEKKVVLGGAAFS